MPANETSSLLILLAMVAMILLLFYAAWRWVHPTDMQPSVPLHSQRQRLPVRNETAREYFRAAVDSC